MDQKLREKALPVRQGILGGEGGSTEAKLRSAKREIQRPVPPVPRPWGMEKSPTAPGATSWVKKDTAHLGRKGTSARTSKKANHDQKVLAQTKELVVGYLLPNVQEMFALNEELT